MNTLTFPVRIASINEHHRTVRGRRDSLGQAFTEEVNLGWFLHLEMLDGEPFGVAIGVGIERPDGFAIGDILDIVLRKR